MVVFTLDYSLRLLWKGPSVLLPVAKVGRIGPAILFRPALVLGIYCPPTEYERLILSRTSFSQPE